MTRKIKGGGVHQDLNLQRHHNHHQEDTYTPTTTRPLHVCERVFYFICYRKQQLELSGHKFRIVQTKSNGENDQKKVVDLDEFYNFVVEDFHLKTFHIPKFCSKFLYFEI